MKKIAVSLAIILSLIVSLLFTGCTTSVYDYDDIGKYVTVGEYKGLEYDKSKLEVTDKEVSERIDKNVKNSTEVKEETDGVVEDGDTVIIDYVGTMDGTQFDGGTAQGRELKIGSNTFIKGFESGLIGKNVGDVASLDLTFPEDYRSKDFAGKDVTFEVTIQKKKVTTEFEYNQEWIESHSDCKSDAEYKEFIKNALINEKKVTIGTELIKQVVEKSEVIEFPDNEWQILFDVLKDKAKQRAKEQGVDLYKMYQMMGCKTEADFEEAVKDQIIEKETEELVVYYIAQKEGLIINSDNLEEYIDNFMKENGYTEASLESGDETLESKISDNNAQLQKKGTTDNVAKFLVDNGKAK